MKVARLSALRTGRPYPQKTFLVLISVMSLSRPQGHSAAGRTMSENMCTVSKDIRLIKESMEESYNCCRKGAELQSLLREEGGSAHFLSDALRRRPNTVSRTTNEHSLNGSVTTGLLLESRDQSPSYL
jgi:hypothetical protein